MLVPAPPSRDEIQIRLAPALAIATSGSVSHSVAQ
jgi:hypothetical protein